MSNTSFYSDVNKTLGSVQTDSYTGFVISLPSTERSISLFANLIDLGSNEAMVHNIRKFEQLDLDNNRAPLNREMLYDDRITSIIGSTVPIRTEDYGCSLIIDNKYSVNTKENIMSSCVALLNDWGSRLEETLLYNKLAGVGITYIFKENGGKANVKDLIRAKNILEVNKARRVIKKMTRATDQVGTRPLGQCFVGHVSLQGKRNFQENITDPTEITTGYQTPGVSQELYRNIYYVNRADVSLFSSTEISDDPYDRRLILHGDEAFVMVSKSPFNSAIITDPSYKSSFGLHSKISYRFSFGAAVCRNERIVNCSFVD